MLRIFALGQDERVNRAVEMIVMPCVKLLTINLPGRNERTTSPSFSSALSVFFLLSAILCDSLMLKMHQKACK